MSDHLTIAGKNFDSRLMVGTGRHRSMDEMVSSIEASGAQIVTVAIGRLDLSNPQEKTILDFFDWDKYTILPNTAGSKTAEQAILTARLGREVTGTNWVKLEVIPEPSHLLPAPIGTYEAAKELIADGHPETAWQLIQSLNTPRIYEGLLEDCHVEDGWVSAPEYLIRNHEFFIRLLGKLPEEKLTQLKFLNIGSNPDLTEAQIDELQKALPKCRSEERSVRKAYRSP